MPRSGSSWSRARACGRRSAAWSGGQMLDLAAEGRFEASPPALGEQDVKNLAGDEDRRASALWLSRRRDPGQGQSEPPVRALERYGSALGEAFQIADDLLDLEGDPATVGKATGKDAAAHKATLVARSRTRGGAAPARGVDRRGAGGPRPIRQRWRGAQGRGALRRDAQRLNIGKSQRGRRARLVQLGGLEPPTSWSTAKRSNQLSYSCTVGGSGRNLGAPLGFDKPGRPCTGLGSHLPPHGKSPGRARAFAACRAGWERRFKRLS